MADKRQTYSIRLDWTGNQGTGTSAYRAYSRAHEISAQGKTVIAGSSNPVFRGDAARWNPAELLIAALSACHQLWYLHLCADAGILVMAYSDNASGVEIEQADGAGQFESVTLRPHAKLAAGSDENIQNAGDTLRKGIEADFTYKQDRWNVYANFTTVNAIFLNALTLGSPNNPFADANGNIFVVPGDHIPAIPNYRFKLGGEYRITDPWLFGADLQCLWQPVACW